MSEKSMRGLVIDALAPYDPVAVENPAFPGTPDVNCTLGWIELKELDYWPRIAPSKPVLIEHFTPQQRVWLIRRVNLGGIADLLVKVGQEWLLFDGMTGALVGGRSSQAEMRRRALVTWPTNTAMKESLGPCLFRRFNSLEPRGSSSIADVVAGLSQRRRDASASGSTGTGAGRRKRTG